MAAEIEVCSSTFMDGEMIPKDFTCDSENISPDLYIGELPPDTKSVALVYDDIDAPKGVFTHWILFNLPPDEGYLPRGVPLAPMLENGARQGKNDFGSIGYGGPCPPSGTHRYFFRFYALDSMLDLQPGAARRGFDEAIKGHVLAEGQLMNKYSTSS
ncbi:MAG: YbhB/YbcL family Raf kinase inhibitor-like protein [Armatimonadetes bacterium]|nr:YbhB/YbcL family Raf kinase inhibitor-like protein [Armatimonadota bacterium]